MAVPFQLPWASGNPNKRAPTDEERSNGHACGPADPDLEDFLKSSHEIAINNIAKQLTYAAGELGKGYDPAGEDQIHELLTSYADIIKQDMAISVPEDYPTVIDAMEYLSNFRLIKGISIIINVAGTSFNHGERVIPGHPDGDQILIQGQPLPQGMVTETDFAATGYDAGSRNADRVTNQTMLQARFPTRFVSSSDGVAVGAGALTFKNILFVGDGDGNGLVASEGGFIGCENVSAHGFAYGFLTDDGGRITAPACTASGCGFFGMTVSRNGVIVAENGVVSGNASGGVQASFGGHINLLGGTAKGNGGSGISASFGGTVQALNAIAKTNGTSGYQVSQDGSIQARGSTATGNQTYGYWVNGEGYIQAKESVATGQTTAYAATDFGSMDATLPGGNTTYSPAKNTTGNGNAYIKG